MLTRTRAGLLSKIGQKISRWLGFRRPDDDLVDLVLVARTDDVIRRQLMAVLSQPEFHRHSMINQWVLDLRLAGAPGALITALTLLLDDERATRTREMLSAPTTGTVASPGEISRR